LRCLFDWKNIFDMVMVDKYNAIWLDFVYTHPH
jgi:hypothetical protein